MERFLAVGSRSAPGVAGTVTLLRWRFAEHFMSLLEPLCIALTVCKDCPFSHSFTLSYSPFHPLP